MSMVKTIKINDNIHSRLLKIGSMGETFEDVIEKLLDYYEDREGKPRKIKTNIDDEEDSRYNPRGPSYKK